MTRNAQQLAGRVALPAGGTRGAGRDIAVELSAAGPVVYVTGRTSNESASPMGRCETIEETAHLVDAAGGTGLAVRVDHSRADEVRALVERIEDDHGRLDLLHFAFSETSDYIGRAVVALAADSATLERTGTVTATWQLAKDYGFTDVDGTRPDWGQHAVDTLGWST